MGMHISTILSRATRAKSKTLSKEELEAEVERCTSMAIKWLPLDARQANKYWDAVSYYQALIEKKYA